jgi:hypothetical protein
MAAVAQRTLMSELGLDGLTREVRRQLLHELVDSLGNGHDERTQLTLTDEVLDELNDRVQEAKNHPERGTAWATFKRDLLKEVDG